MTQETLLPFIDEDNAPFWQGCKEGKLYMQQCPETKRLIFPPRPVNPWSPRHKSIWIEVSGYGTIWSVIEPHPPLMLNFSELAPYNVILVALEEDSRIRLVGNLVTKAEDPINTIAYDDIKIGTPVRVVFDPINEEITLPRWVAT